VAVADAVVTAGAAVVADTVVAGEATAVAAVGVATAAPGAADNVNQILAKERSPRRALFFPLGKEKTLSLTAALALAFEVMVVVGKHKGARDL
jgi:hypothetical protein